MPLGSVVSGVSFFLPRAPFFEAHVLPPTAPRLPRGAGRSSPPPQDRMAESPPQEQSDYADDFEEDSPASGEEGSGGFEELLAVARNASKQLIETEKRGVDRILTEASRQVRREDRAELEQEGGQVGGPAMTVQQALHSAAATVREQRGADGGAPAREAASPAPAPAPPRADQPASTDQGSAKAAKARAERPLRLTFADEALHEAPSSPDVSDQDADKSADQDADKGANEDANKGTHQGADQDADEDAASSFGDDYADDADDADDAEAPSLPPRRPPRRTLRERCGALYRRGGASPRRRRHGQKPLHERIKRLAWEGVAEDLAVEIRDGDAAEELLRTDAHGWTALHWASARGREECAALLLYAAEVAAEAAAAGGAGGHGGAFLGDGTGDMGGCSKGALLDKADDLGGWTPLHLAAIAGHEGLVRLLLDEGADPRARDANGDVATDLVKGMKDARKRQSIAALLRGFEPEGAEEKGAAGGERDGDAGGKEEPRRRRRQRKGGPRRARAAERKR